MLSQKFIEQLQSLHQQEKTFVEIETGLLDKVKSQLTKQKLESLLLMVEGLSTLRKALHIEIDHVLTKLLSDQILLPFDQTPIEHLSSNEQVLISDLKGMPKPKVDLQIPVNKLPHFEQADTPVINVQDEQEQAYYHQIPPVLGDVSAPFEIEIAMSDDEPPLDEPPLDDIEKSIAPNLSPLPFSHDDGIDQNLPPIVMDQTPPPLDLDISLPQDHLPLEQASDLPPLEDNKIEISDFERFVLDETPFIDDFSKDDLPKYNHLESRNLEPKNDTPSNDFMIDLPKFTAFEDDDDEDLDIPPKINDLDSSVEEIIEEELLSDLQALPFINSHTPITLSNANQINEIIAQIEQEQEQEQAQNQKQQASQVSPQASPQVSPEQGGHFQPITQIGMPNAFVKPLISPNVKIEEASVKSKHKDQNQEISIEEFGKTQFLGQIFNQDQTPEDQYAAFVDLFPQSIGHLDGGVSIEVTNPEMENEQIHQEEIDVQPEAFDFNDPQFNFVQPIAIEAPVPIKTSKMKISMMVKVIGPNQQREELFCSMISKGSLFLETRRPYQVGEEIFLAFNLPTGHSIQTWGMVRSVKTDKFATIDSPAGMEIFFSLKDESKKALDLLLGD